MLEMSTGVFEKCKGVALYLGKKGRQGIENPDTKSLYIILDPEDILIPWNYKGK